MKVKWHFVKKLHTVACDS